MCVLSETHTNTPFSQIEFGQRGAHSEDVCDEVSIMGAGGEDAKYILRDPAIERYVSCQSALSHDFEHLLALASSRLPYTSERSERSERGEKCRRVPTACRLARPF